MLSFPRAVVLRLFPAAVELVDFFEGLRLNLQSYRDGGHLQKERRG